jgi:DNA-binding GntR family transcriptional regulator
LPTPGARIRRTSKAPRYVQLAEDLRGLILKARAEPGTPFPTEAELCRTYDVSRFTVREALRRLEQEGLIARRRGSGTVLQPAAARGGALHQPLSNVGEILQYARGTQISFERLPDGAVPARFAEQVADDVSGTWLRLAGLRRQHDGTPLAYTEVFVDPALGHCLDHLDPKRFTLFRQLAEQGGLSVDRVTQEIQAVPIPASLAAKLDMKARAPSLRVIRCYYAGERLFEISVSHHPGDRFAYSTHIEIGG